MLKIRQAEFGPMSQEFWNETPNFTRKKGFPNVLNICAFFLYQKIKAQQKRLE